MVKSFPRLLLGFSAVVLALGGVMHATAFKGARAALASVPLLPFYSNSFKALWLIDSATLLCLALLFGFIAARPAAASRWVIVLLALIPASTAALIYIFLGSFIAAHLLALSALAAIIGGLQYPGLTTTDY